MMLSQNITYTPSLIYQESTASEQLVWMLEEQRQKGLPSAFPSGEEAKLEGRKQGGDDQSWKINWWKINNRSFSIFQTKIKMAALVKKAPALFNAAMELAKPQLNTFLRYAKVIQSKKNFWPSDIPILRFVIIIKQVELAPPSPGEIPVAIADISTKVWICFDSR